MAECWGREERGMEKVRVEGKGRVGVWIKGN